MTAHLEMSRSVTAGSGLSDVNYGHTIAAVCSTMTALALLIVCMRCYVRMIVVRAVGWDDILMVIAAGFNVSIFGLIAGQVYYGAGRHAVYIMAGNSGDIVNGLRLNFISQPVTLVGITLIKTSVAVFLLRLGPPRGYFIFIWCMIIFMSTYTVAAIITVFLQCTPLRGIWDSSVPTVCFSRSVLLILSYLNQTLVILSDLVFAILPPVMLRKVQINFRVKLALFGITSLGIFAAAASLIKTSFIANYGKTGDFLFDSKDLSIWTAMEMTTGIIAGSIPSLKPLFRGLLRGSSSASNHGSNIKRNTRGYAMQDKPYTSRKNTTIKNSGEDVDDVGDLQNFDLYVKRDISSGVIVSSKGRRGITHSDDSSDDGLLTADAGKRGILKTTTVEITSHQADSDDCRSTREIV